ncbi:hypothetical protein [Paraburkholderia sp. SIMBA_054]|uniref:hypothetical protein n=1 Tax=Paraburkholderia sp. SIMBA_054 TaxID=3085795 RepID=UPI00397BADFE
MSTVQHRTRAASRVKRHRYADRVKAVPNGDSSFDVLIDGDLRFRLEGDSQWPAQWRLFPVTNGVRAAESIAIENESWDLLGALERGAYWMPLESVERAECEAPREPTYTRFPEYLREH